MKKVILSCALFFLVCVSISGQVNLKSGLVAYYPFNGSANDESGNGNNGVVHGATLTTDRFGNANSSYSFNGTDNWIDCGNNSSLNTGNEISVSLWYNANVLNNSNTLIARWGCFHEHLYPDQIAARYFTTNENQIGNIPFPTTLNQWIYLTWTIDNTSVTFFRNGVQVATYKKTGTLSVISKNHLSIGCLLDWTPGQSYLFNGKIDDVRIYNRVINAQEIQALYKEVNTTALVNLQRSSIKVFPTIIENSFQVTGFEGDAIVNLVGFNGKIYINKRIINNETIAVGHLSSGCYMLRIKTNSGLIERKLIKK